MKFPAKDWWEFNYTKPCSGFTGLIELACCPMVGRVGFWFRPDTSSSDYDIGAVKSCRLLICHSVPSYFKLTKGDYHLHNTCQLTRLTYLNISLSSRSLLFSLPVEISGFVLTRRTWTTKKLPASVQREFWTSCGILCLFVPVFDSISMAVLVVS